MSNIEYSKANAPDYPAMRGEICRIDSGGLQGMITLRADLELPAVKLLLRDIADAPPPGLGQIILQGNRGVARMSPDELLIYVPYREVPKAIEELEAALKNAHNLVVDVSDARARFILQGLGAVDALQKGMPVNFRDQYFPVGSFRRSRLENIAVAVGRIGPATYQLLCFRSYGDYVWKWLHKAADGRIVT